MEKLIFENLLFLAPLAGYTDLPFRSVVKRFGVDVTVSEMVSSHALVHAFNKTAKMLEKSPEEQPFSVQIAGSKEQIVAQAVEKINGLKGIDIIDFNCGCPAPKVANHGNGSGLLKDLNHLVQLLRLIKEKSNKPYSSVKVRLGFESKIPLEIAHALNDAPVDFVVVHARTRADRYKKERIDYESVRLMRQVLNKPLIANGEIDSPKKAREVLAYTGANGVMIGRSSLTQPWIFWQIKNNTEDLPAVLKKDLVLEHFDKMVAFYGDRGVVMFRKNLHAYAKGHANAGAFKTAVNSMTQPQEARAQIEEFFSAPTPLSPLPQIVSLNNQSV
ncbi:tRNA dihydrouridine synthase [Helicobacter ailurogastricus]|uniref:tRNA-dihydrouridine synthase n=1 Tax=Helicobacter ailurogastricus TaxID=1578720 RepID=A0A0K2XZS1_9HELI|nr:tRNA-dihydrouridine synthase [Helicobacter ailurogastricus]BDQ29766.1 putative tRNA-dihydrouridine synthase [Helicobacter ailurogastricus]GLH58492.1 tRNA-dihydrouridine synthase B [Helicobacter ailurogastricus]GLH59999.1 tRNA-dihydrouridine synthase B [Helicobacter ailurogastricus]CRF52596.1 tRNA dihydrouridine synthase B [Helicobacter ailurogastricus]